MAWLRENLRRGFYKGVLCGDDRVAAFPDGGYLVNIDRRANPGTHWTALAVRGPWAYYVDPAGYPPPKALHESLLSAGRTTLCSDSRNQREGTNCGLRAALALREFSRAPSDAAAARIFERLAE